MTVITEIQVIEIVITNLRTPDLRGIHDDTNW